MRLRLAYQVGQEKKTEEAEPKPKLGPILGRLMRKKEAAMKKEAGGDAKHKLYLLGLTIGKLEPCNRLCMCSYQSILHFEHTKIVI